MQAIPRSQTVYIPLPTTVNAGSKISLPDVPELRQGIAAIGFEVVTADQLTFAPDGLQMVTTADAAGLSITLLKLSTQQHRNVPVLSWNPLYTFGVWKEVAPFLPNWQGSWLTAGTTFTGGTYLGLVVYYLETGKPR